MKAKTVARGRNNQLLKQAGEYLVASELARRGLLVATFSGNVPDLDIIATGLNGSSCPIQVKTIKAGGWQFSLERFVEITFQGRKQLVGSKKPLQMPNLVCVFVLAAETYGGDQFFVVEWSKVQDILIDAHTRYLDSCGGIRPKNPESLHCSIFPFDVQEYKDNWSVITSRL